MAHLDLEEQEQLDQLKHFWSAYGNLITGLLIVVFGAYAAWNGWNWWQRDQSLKASAMYEELDRAAAAADAERTGRIFGELKDRFGGTVYAGQGGLLAAKLQLAKGQADAAASSLAWVADHAKEGELQTVAALRLAGLLIEQKKYDEALKRLDAAKAPEFEGLVADRRGDVLMAQGKQADALAAYRKAHAALDAKLDYRRLVDAKLTALGAAPEADKPTTTDGGVVR